MVLKAVGKCLRINNFSFFFIFLYKLINEKNETFIKDEIKYNIILDKYCVISQS